MEGQTNNLISAISNFDEHFSSLVEGSSLTDKKLAFTAGVKAASLLASNIDSYIRDYIYNTVVYHSECGYKGEEYSI